MKNIFFIITLILGVSFLQSCKKDTPSSTNSSSPTLSEILTSSNNVNTDYHITFVANDYLFGGSDPVDNLDISGSFFDKNHKAIDLKKFTVGGYTIPRLPNGQYLFHPSSNTVPSNIDVVSSLCGKPIEYIIESEVFGTIATESYIPALLNTSIRSAGTQLIDKSEPLTINWQPSASVAGRDPNQITGVVIVYHAGFSLNTETGGLPTKNITIYKDASDESGSITFLPSDLSVFPLNGYVTIYCGRAAQSILSLPDGTSLGITNIVLSTSTDMRIQ